ncbi:F-box/LRR-repeat protein At3g58900 isoform X2 [Brachypodium distachyon]|uniref:F-box/LRR-repeat protein At3g58900 isoform X2 n=1 Tax=Brachypodium distachyon TaxID=15368 RepID=UPI00071C31BF|nr:F-box/LRR-repeat protein At3g58900 isoform X2 [Brachypodium distachyon]|eukprot:XP_014755870.1 F-box/LRR-repeat protein At3g58900 isoform X2 [Brachypodium distachyon]
MSRSNGRLGAGDRISALPDELIHNVMSCLTAQEAVQTCVLARWWQNVWASARCLNLDSARFTGLQRFKKFVDSLIVHRGCTPLDAFWEAIHVLARDLTRCKPFRNLKALSLGEWCLNAGGNTLLYWIRCSPNIEKLILHLSRPGSYYYAHPEEYTAAEVDPACNGTETTPRCINLKKIEIHCPRGDKRVHFIVKILLANITSLPEINIKQYNI